MDYFVRKAVFEDLARIEEIYAYARSFMEKTGNPNQWGKIHPPHDQLVQDIQREMLYVIADQSGIHGVFYFYIGEDSTYAVIYDGAWHSDRCYGTIHRIAGDGSGGILRTAVAYGEKQIGYLRIDTHRDNRVMQNALERSGFQRCGIIYLPDGSPRIAYDRV